MPLEVSIYDMLIKRCRRTYCVQIWFEYLNANLRHKLSKCRVFLRHVFALNAYRKITSLH